MHELKYRENSYFEEGKEYLVWDLETEKKVTAEYLNGAWFAKEGLRYKLTSVKCRKL